MAVAIIHSSADSIGATVEIVTVCKAVGVVGIGEDGCIGLPGRARNAITRSLDLAREEPQLASSPEFEDERVTFKKGLDADLEGLAESR